MILLNELKQGSIAFSILDLNNNKGVFYPTGGGGPLDSIVWYS